MYFIQKNNITEECVFFIAGMWVHMDGNHLHNHYTNSFTLLGKKITLSTFYEINNNTNNNW